MAAVEVKVTFCPTPFGPVLCMVIPPEKVIPILNLWSKDITPEVKRNLKEAYLFKPRRRRRMNPQSADAVRKSLLL